MRRFTFILIVMCLALPCLAQGDITYDDGLGFFVEGGQKNDRITRPNPSEAQRPFLGLSVSPLNANHESMDDIPGGVVVSRIVRGSSADVAGIRSGDVLLTINGTGIEYPEDLVELIQLYEPGQMVALDVWRAGKRLSVDVRLGSRPLPQEKKWALIWDENRPYIGIDSTTLHPQLAKHFGVEYGVLVNAVREKTSAEKAGLQAGDIILAWGENPIKSRELMGQQLKAAKAGDQVLLKVFRSGETRAMTLTLGSRKGYFFNEDSQQSLYANRDYIVLPEALPEGTGMLLEELGNRQEAAAMKKELEALRKEVDKLRSTIAKMQSSLEIKK